MSSISRLMFWTEQGRYSSQLVRASLDGSNVVVVVPAGEGLWLPQDLTIDLTARQLYWVDSRTEEIKTCDFDGHKR